jgi:drug/metabolite transporter (DMT)-like permease
MMANLTSTATLHLALAMFCIVVGLVQLLRPKRGASHRARGYAFVYAMLVTDGTALLLYRFTGQFNALHVGAIANLICIVMAIVPMLRNPRPKNWKYHHYYWIAWSYVGLMSAAATQLVVRLGLPTTRGQSWAVTLAATMAVSAIGYILIEKNRPNPEPGSALAGAIQHEGVPL